MSQGLQDHLPPEAAPDQREDVAQQAGQDVDVVGIGQGAAHLLNVRTVEEESNEEGGHAEADQEAARLQHQASSMGEQCREG